MDKTTELARRQPSVGSAPAGDTWREAISIYIETFPNIARDRVVWPVIEQGIQRRFAKVRAKTSIWKSECLRSLESHVPGSLSGILYGYDRALHFEEELKRSQTPALPEKIVNRSDLNRLMVLLVKRLNREITQAQFTREADALAKEE